MATKADKKNAIRQGIIEAAIVYSQSLAGKTFLYVYGDEYFEVSFPVDHFLHLTGVETRLSAKDFYFIGMQKRLFLQMISSILMQDIYMQMPKRNFHV